MRPGVPQLEFVLVVEAAGKVKMLVRLGVCAQRRRQHPQPQPGVAVTACAAPDELIAPGRYQLVEERRGVDRAQARCRVRVERERDEP